MRIQLLFRRPTVPFWVVLMLVLAGWHRVPRRPARPQKPESNPAAVKPSQEQAAPSQTRAAETDQSRPATETRPEHEATTVDMPWPD